MHFLQQQGHKQVQVPFAIVSINILWELKISSPITIIAFQKKIQKRFVKSLQSDFFRITIFPNQISKLTFQALIILLKSFFCRDMTFSENYPGYLRDNCRIFFFWNMMRGIGQLCIAFDHYRIDIPDIKTIALKNKLIKIYFRGNNLNFHLIKLLI